MAVDSWYKAASIPGEKRGWPCRFTAPEPGSLGAKNHTRAYARIELSLVQGSTRLFQNHRLKERTLNFVHHIAKNNSFTLGNNPTPIQDRFTLMGLCLPAADKLDFPLNIPKCVGTNLVKNEMHCENWLSFPAQLLDITGHWNLKLFQRNVPEGDCTIWGLGGPSKVQNKGPFPVIPVSHEWRNGLLMCSVG